MLSAYVYTVIQVKDKPQDSSASKAAEYKLNDHGLDPGRHREFFLFKHHVVTNSGFHPDLLQW
jgi:hypothetical protein